MMTSIHALLDDGTIQLAIPLRDQAKGEKQQEAQVEHVEACFDAYLGLQYLLLNESGYVRPVRSRPRRADRKIPLVAPYTSPGKVHVSLLTDEIVRDADNICKRSRLMAWHCPAWGVRGHYRHYKTGKMTYVKPYVKGKEKAAYVGREYLLIGGEQ